MFESLPQVALPLGAALPCALTMATRNDDDIYVSVRIGEPTPTSTADVSGVVTQNPSPTDASTQPGSSTGSTTDTGADPSSLASTGIAGFAPLIGAAILLALLSLAVVRLVGAARRRLS